MNPVTQVVASIAVVYGAGSAALAVAEPLPVPARIATLTVAGIATGAVLAALAIRTYNTTPEETLMPRDIVDRSAFDEPKPPPPGWFAALVLPKGDYVVVETRHDWHIYTRAQEAQSS